MGRWRGFADVPDPEMDIGWTLTKRWYFNLLTLLTFLTERRPRRFPF